MERLLNQNTYQNKQARYRGLKPLADDGNFITNIIIF